MAKLTEVTIPVLRIQKDSWSDTYYVQQRQGNGETQGMTTHDGFSIRNGRKLPPRPRVSP